MFGESATEETMKAFKEIESSQRAMIESITSAEMQTFGHALDQYIAENVPLMSKMKYVTFDIAESFKKMASSIFELNELLSTVLKNQQKLNKTIKLNDKYKVDDMILKLKDGLDGWSTWCLVSKNLINDHFSNYLHFRKHELMALKELSIMRQSANEAYNNARGSLQAKKQKLFETRNIEKWGTKSTEFKEPLEDVLKNFSVAEKYILPKEAVKLTKVKELSDFMNNSVYYEYVLFNKRDQRRIIKNFHQYAKKVGRATRTPDTIWNIFEHLGVDDQNPNEMAARGPILQGTSPGDPGLDSLESDLDQAISQSNPQYGNNERGFLD